MATSPRAPESRSAPCCVTWGCLPLGFFASTVLLEFCVHGVASRRFTFVHILRRMGFDAVDVNDWGAGLDETFFRRVFTDMRLSFVPRVSL